MKKNKLKVITITFFIILVTMVAFVGVYVQEKNIMENKVKDYSLAMDLNGTRNIVLKVSEETTEEHDNSIEVKESNRLTCNNIPGDNDHSRYDLINEMIISDTLSDETTLKSNIDEYKRLDAATKRLFKLI